MNKSLAELKVGENALVKNIQKSSLRSKLIELGLTENTTISVKFQAPFGDPIAIDVKGYLLSLRKSEAALINVETI